MRKEMRGELGVYRTNSPNLSTSTNASDGVKDQFPAGMRVLVVDDDQMTLVILETMLRRCSYDVTTCGKATSALAMLRENKNRFDLVISDVYMPDMDGFKLLELVGLEMDLPVIMMSTDGDYNNVLKGITHGACDYLLKPVRMEELRNIWQHVIRKRKNEVKDFPDAATPNETSPAGGENHKLLRRGGSGGAPGGAEEPEHTSSTNSKKRKDVKEEDDGIENDSEDPSSMKKPRVVWSVELHQQFVNAVNQLNIDKAVPKKILELMDVPGLTRENVASHLQKYRLYLKRISVQQPQSSMNLSFGCDDSRSQHTFSMQPLPGGVGVGVGVGVQQGVLGRIGTTANGLASTALDQTSLLQLSGSSPPVFRPRIPSPVFNTQGAYLPSFTGYALEQSPVAPYPAQQVVKQHQHPGMGSLGGIPGGFSAQAGNPLMVHLLQQRQQQQQQQLQFAQGIHSHPQLQPRGIPVSNEISLGVNTGLNAGLNDDIGFATGGLGTGIGGGAASGFRPGVGVGVAESLGTVVGDTGVGGGGKNLSLAGVVDSNFSPASLAGVQLVSPTPPPMFGPEVSPAGVLSPGSFNSNLQIPQQQQQFRKSLREEKSTADSSFKPARVIVSSGGVGSRVGAFELDQITTAAALAPVPAPAPAPASDDLLSFYLKQQQQEDLGFVDNDLAGFDGFVADNLYVK